jgi:hypothetical protein
MKISKTHQRLSERLKEPKVLTNPEDFLGPNWEDVINFWFYIETLSEEERKKIDFSYRRDLEYVLKTSAADAAWSAAYDVVGGKVRDAAWYAPHDVSDYWVFSDATNELIASHKLLEQDKTLVFLPLCLNP